MKLKYLIVLILAFGNIAFTDAQETILTAKELSLLQGNWEGTLTYLDYTSGKPYTMPANLKVQQMESTRKFLLFNVYLNETSASVDTLILSEDGKTLNKNKVVRQENYRMEALRLLPKLPVKMATTKSRR